jgi:hypothetical protein
MLVAQEYEIEIGSDFAGLRIGQSASRTVVNGDMSLRRLKLSI